MVGIVIIDVRSIKLALIFHTASSAVEGSQALCGSLTRDSHHPCHTGSCQGIDGIVLAVNRQFKVAILLAVADHIKPPPVIRYIGSVDAVTLTKAKADIFQTL